MNSVARSLAQRALHRREVRDGLQRPATAAAGNKSKQAAAGYSTSTADRLAAYRHRRSEGGYLLVRALVAVGAGTWFIATAATRYVRRTPRQGTTTTTATAATTTSPVVEGPGPEVVVIASPP